MLWSSLVLTVALSVDGFIVGLHYGMRKIALPLNSLGAIALFSALGMAASMYFGDVAADVLDPDVARSLGGGVIIALGAWQLFQVFSERKSRKAAGVIAQILIDPATADQDLSGKIDLKEAVLLGAALGLDTLAAGFAAAVLGMGPWLIASVSAGLLALVALGVAIGRRIGGKTVGDRGAFMPGLLLIAMGILQL